MKKKILSGLFVSALLIAAGAGAMESRKSEAGLSDLAMANVEALAQYEGSGDDLAALCRWSPNEYCHYYVVFPNDAVTLTPQNRYRIETDSIFTLGLHKMDNGYYVTQVLIGHKNMFVLFNEKLEVYKTFGDAPIEEIHDENYSQLYGWFASKGNKLFFAVQGMGYLVCYDISDNGNVKKDWETKFTVPKYELNPSFRWKNDNKRGFYDIQVNNEYLFLSFSGKSYEEEEVLPEGVLILDHKGELVDYIKLDNNHTMAKFTVSGDSIFTYNKFDQLLMFNWRQTISRK